MKIYTKSGDNGETSLFSGERVSKGHLQVETYGNLDELNSVLGLLVCYLPSEQKLIIEFIQSIQSNLFKIGSLLATMPDSAAISKLEPMDKKNIYELENKIDDLQKVLPELKEFIIPGGHISAAWAHFARTVCRRTERQVVRLIGQSQKNKSLQLYHNSLIYLNRLSDFLFVLAQYCNKIHGIYDQPRKK